MREITSDWPIVFLYCSIRIAANVSVLAAPTAKKSPPIFRLSQILAKGLLPAGGLFVGWTIKLSEEAIDLLHAGQGVVSTAATDGNRASGARAAQRVVARKSVDQGRSEAPEKGVAGPDGIDDGGRK